MSFSDGPRYEKVTDERNPQDHARELAAAEQMDWQQVVLNGGPPCFHLERDRGLFCGRAQRWGGHGSMHKFISLADLLAAHTASQLAGAVPQELREVLYRCIKELDYVQSAEHISQCASAEGKELIELGMKLLGVQDLSRESLVERRGE